MCGSLDNPKTDAWLHEHNYLRNTRREEVIVYERIFHSSNIKDLK